MEQLLDHEVPIRLTAFFAVFALVAIAERLWPRRERLRSTAVRWTNNLGLTFLNSAIGRVVLPMAPVVLAAWVSDHGGGLFGLAGLTGWPAVVLGVVVLDFLIYVQHVVFHAVPALWRLHRMHHADVDYDVTTGARFHPVEIVLSLGIKLAAVAALGVPPVAVLLFEVILNATAMFNHGNLKLPASVDRILRWIVVTPDMHRVHHSVVPKEMHSNFGFNLPWWDRLLGTYVPEPAAGQEGMTIGLRAFRDPAEQRLDRMITQPWRDEPGADGRSERPADPAGLAA